MTVRWTEVVTPFRDTMGFIDCNSGKFPLVVDRRKDLTKGLCEDQLGSYVNQPGMRMS